MPVRSHKSRLFLIDFYVPRFLPFARFFLFRRTKKKPRRGAFVNRCSMLLSWQHGDALALFVHALGAHDPVDQREQSIIAPHPNFFPRMNTGSELTHQNISGPPQFAAQNLHAPALALTVAAV